MTTADEYRQFAEDCLRRARDAKDEAERKTFLDMAWTWTKAAAAKPTNAKLRQRPRLKPRRRSPQVVSSRNVG
jgi:hypothetical protein